MRKPSKNWLTLSHPTTGETDDLPAGHVAKLLNVQRRTVESWIIKGKLPAMAARLLHFLALGMLPDPLWHRFRLYGGVLVNTASGERYTPAQLETVYLSWQQLSHTRQRLTAAEKENRQLRRRLAEQNAINPPGCFSTRPPRQLDIFPTQKSLH
tara:strand:+ start:96337 stop:96798 length:462 start_codon:yes stop_codon:yes gene_type:complete